MSRLAVVVLLALACLVAATAESVEHVSYHGHRVVSLSIQTREQADAIVCVCVCWYRLMFNVLMLVSTTTSPNNSSRLLLAWTSISGPRM
jgi:hypothetical protein